MESKKMVGREAFASHVGKRDSVSGARYHRERPEYRLAVSVTAAAMTAAVGSTSV